MHQHGKTHDKWATKQRRKQYRRDRAQLARPSLPALKLTRKLS